MIATQVGPHVFLKVQIYPKGLECAIKDELLNFRDTKTNLCGDHYVGLVQNEDGNLAQIKEPELETPVKHLARGADNYIVCDLRPSGNLFTPHSISDGEVGTESRHLAGNFSDL